MRNWLKKVIIDGSFDKSNNILGVLGGIFAFIDISNLDDWCIWGKQISYWKNIILFFCCIIFYILCYFFFLWKINK